MRSPNHSLCKSLLGTPSPAPSVVKHSLSICAPSVLPWAPVLWATWEREVDLPRQHHSFIWAARPRGRGCHLSLCSPAPISTFLLAPGVRGGPMGTALWSVRAPGEAVVVLHQGTGLLVTGQAPSSPEVPFPTSMPLGYFRANCLGFLVLQVIGSQTFL